MQAGIVYSSVTGNTKRLAEAMAHATETPVYTVSAAPEASKLAGLGLLALGFWVRRGLPDPAMLRFMESLHGQKLFLFGTLGAWPDSPHALHCLEMSTRLLEGNANCVAGTFLCQGRVNPRIAASAEQQGRHPMTPERAARLEEASRHPDERDIAEAVRRWQHCVAACR